MALSEQLVPAVVVLGMTVMAAASWPPLASPPGGGDRPAGAGVRLVPKPPPRGGGVLVEDRFEGEDDLITSHSDYEDVPFPGRGRSRSSNRSTIWEGGSGFFFRQHGWGWSGRPEDWKDRYFFRMNTRASTIGDALISWTYRSAAFGRHGFPVEGPDAVDLWLRYRTQFDLYALQFDRTNDGIQAKRKLPAQGWRGPKELVANKGAYYTLVTDEEQPIFGAGHPFISWSGVRELLPESERAKPGFPNLAHDVQTPYQFAVVVRNVAADRVQIQAFRAGVLVYSATDDGRSAVAVNHETLGMHLDRGWFDGVPGWKPSSGKPLTAPGALGFRADNIEFWVKDFVVRALE